jgi:GntR family transcriptional regulator
MSPIKSSVSKSKHDRVLGDLIKLAAAAKPHSQLPPERALSEYLGVSRMTLRRALEVMQSRGVLYTIPSKGLFVSEPRFVSTSDVTGLSEVLRHRGNKPLNTLHLSDRIPAPEKIAADLNINKGDFIYRIEQSFLDGDIPMATETAYIPCEIAPGLLDHDLSRSLSAILGVNYEKPVLKVSYRVRSLIPPEKFQLRLGFTKIDPCLEFHAIGRSYEDRPVFLVDSYKRGDKYDLTYDLEIDHQNP